MLRGLGLLLPVLGLGALLRFEVVLSGAAVFHMFQVSSGGHNCGVAQLQQQLCSKHMVPPGGSNVSMLRPTSVSSRRVSGLLITFDL